MSFSVVIPMFNASEYIVGTIESCMSQTYLPKEIIIVDDCSSDDSFEMVEQWKRNYKGRIEIVLDQFKVNSGPSKARNRGWDLASGEYISFLDADDSFVVSKLEIVNKVLENKREIILLAHAYALEERDIDEKFNLQHITTKQLLFKNLSTTPSIVVKRSIEERFDESMRYTEDHDLWLRITQKYGKTYSFDKVLTIIDRPVRTEGGQSSNLWAMRKGEITMYKKYCKTNNRMIVFPLLAAFSLSKHMLKMIQGRS